ncbi:hypothetical protein B0T22DRAFT_513756 [Podospora appendiculata]|uniref:SET domain-containing protein n=1 Tax=Podospora appendiculata TaxID=314037 RepID=A0AAE1CDA1_9PEZI|nr:hypothetical protein B0T22DRAFT_513756 [Podospora appendiculata]
MSSLWPPDSTDNNWAPFTRFGVRDTDGSPMDHPTATDIPDYMHNGRVGCPRGNMSAECRALLKPVSRRTYACLNCDRVARADNTQCTIDSCYVPFMAHFDYIHSNAGLPRDMVEIRQTGTNQGYGVFARVTIPADTIIGFYLGEVHEKRAFFRDPMTTSWYVFTTTRAAIDSQDYGNWTRFVNSHCDPNVSASLRNVGQVEGVAFQTIRQINPGEQLYINYGRGYFAGDGDQPLLYCTCDAFKGPHLPPFDDDHDYNDGSRQEVTKPKTANGWRNKYRNTPGGRARVGKAFSSIAMTRSRLRAYLKTVPMDEIMKEVALEKRQRSDSVDKPDPISL